MTVGRDLEQMVERPIPAFSHQNNFDIIRLIAALQVAIVHGVEHLGLRLPFHDVSFEILKAFPGVPIFFVISGFLISASYDRSRSLEIGRASCRERVWR